MLRVNLIFLLAFPYLIIAQYNVDTNVQYGNILIEEFTGVKCSNCPRGHALVDSLLGVMGHRLNVVGVHPMTSSLTSPINSTDKDLRTSHGDSIYSHPLFGRHAMPGAIINRSRRYNYYSNPPDGSAYYMWIPDMENTGYPLTWESAIDTLWNEISPVNIALQSIYNGETKSLVIDVEVYYTSDMAVGETHNLNIYLTEDSLIAEQFGSGGGPNYAHNHILRHCITSTWGDDIGDNNKKGDFLSYSYTVSDVDDYIDNPNKAHIIAFISNGKAEAADGSSPNKIGEVYTSVQTGFDVAFSIVDYKATNTPKLKLHYKNNTNDLLIFTNNSNAHEVLVEVWNIQSKKIKSKRMYFSKGYHIYSIPFEQISPGIYFLNIITNNGQKTYPWSVLR